MNDEPFSLTDAEVLFGADNMARIDREVKAAPRFSAEQMERLRALFASVRAPAKSSSADAA